MYKILIVDDDLEILKLMKTAVEMKNYQVVVMNKIFIPLRSTDFKGFDLILLDIMMPNMDGTDICNAIRNQIATPIMFVSAKDSEEDIINGLNVGGDDYMVKPFSLKQLTAKVEAHIKREERNNKATDDFNNIRRDVGPFTFYLEEKRLFLDGKIVKLTNREYRIMALLSAKPSKTYSKEEIYELVYDEKSSALFRSIPEYIYQIRTKLNNFEINPIKTVRGMGYKWYD